MTMNPLAPYVRHKPSKYLRCDKNAPPDKCCWCGRKINPHAELKLTCWTCAKNPSLSC